MPTTTSACSRTSQIDRSKLSADEQKMFDGKNGPVNAETLRNFLRRAIDQKLTPGSNANAQLTNLQAALLALASSAAALPALAGGPLIVVPTSHGVLPARWEGTVNVYTDLGTLGVVDNALANQAGAQFAQGVECRSRPRTSARGLRAPWVTWDSAISPAPTRPA